MTQTANITLAGLRLERYHGRPYRRSHAANRRHETLKYTVSVCVRLVCNNPSQHTAFQSISCSSSCMGNTVTKQNGHNTFAHPLKFDELLEQR